ncbi:MAG: polysaccharide deacetylase family protein [Clostridia bacterium]|nr:polysaccharide deacetylase family protein [Clostridia bacterium]
MHAATEVSWYFKKNSEHKQPTLDANLEFINNYSCYYVDKNHGDSCEDKVIYLTFDAGYENGNVEKILDVLKEKNVKGAFFVLGHLIENNTALVKRMVDEGHLVCNHTASHKNMAKVTDSAKFKEELEKLEVLYEEKIGGEMPKFYRPPEGTFTEDNLKMLEQLGYKTILWSFAYADWDNNKQLSPDTAMEKLINGTHNGEILLLHPTSATNAQILNKLIDTWREMGYRFGTLDEL